VKKSTEAKPWTWLFKKAFQVWEGGSRCLCNRSGYRALGNLHSQLEQLPVSAGAPHSRLAAAIFRIRARIAGLASGRPPLRLEIRLQKRRKPWRCQATTVSGLTMTSGRCQSSNSWTATPKRSDPPFAAEAAGTALEHGELLTKGEVLQGDIAEAAGRNEKTKQRTKQRDHGV